jgi:hypothetical protein
MWRGDRDLPLERPALELGIVHASRKLDRDVEDLVLTDWEGARSQLLARVTQGGFRLHLEPRPSGQQASPSSRLEPASRGVELTEPLERGERADQERFIRGAAGEGAFANRGEVDPRALPVRVRQVGVDRDAAIRHRSCLVDVRPDQRLFGAPDIAPGAIGVLGEDLGQDLVGRFRLVPELQERHRDGGGLVGGVDPVGLAQVEPGVGVLALRDEDLGNGLGVARVSGGELERVVELDERVRWTVHAEMSGTLLGVCRRAVFLRRAPEGESQDEGKRQRRSNHVRCRGIPARERMPTLLGGAPGSRLRLRSRGTGLPRELSSEVRSRPRFAPAA